MKLRKIILTLSFFSLSLTAFSGDKVIYGEDDRVDPYDASPLYQEWARSTAAMIPSRKLREKMDNSWEISGGTLLDRNICEDERFTDQVTAASCSGFLVADDIMVTAGHCIQTEGDCRRNVWVFDYALKSPGDQDYGQVDQDNVYKCKKIIDTKLESSSKADYAVIQLERAVINRTPLKVRTRGKVKTGDALVIIGHPTGLPLKIADGARVRTNANSVYFVANLDSFAGNSGSAVFNEETGEVEGILVRGETDYIRHSTRRCQVPKRCTNLGCRGEDVTRITSIKKLMKLLKDRN